MGVATVIAVLLSRLAVVQRWQDFEARHSLLSCCRSLCSKNRHEPRPELDEDPRDSNEHPPQNARGAEDDISIETHSDAESEVEESLLGTREPVSDHHTEHSAPSYWLRLQYSVLFVFFASHFELSNVILMHLRPCEEGYMAVHPWIACSWRSTESPQYVVLLGMSYTFLVLYVVGIPALFAFLLWRYRTSIRDLDEKVEHRMGFLYETYKRDVFYFEAIWLLRRILLSLSLALLGPASGFRTAAIALVLLASLFVQQGFKPFQSSFVNTLETISTTTLLYSFVVGREIEQASLRPILQTILWLLNALVVVLLMSSLIAPTVAQLFKRCCKRKTAVRLE